MRDDFFISDLEFRIQLVVSLQWGGDPKKD